ncbi:aldo/keto reductase [Thalassospira sp. MCCC 1A01428]|uniref:aldo/keto reductase n=1 Tax=Thalassospira sp. MCCC 1A01428 TaxID=1470575 RepID=UPI000A1DBDE6|nr:aldo/keto reductase [Thalassospira sp. MCCC 1A01428]OSQ43053.1 pyridoxal 4-dehydrogenase [Thalassospira sp. MCCC 1A01428]
MARQKRQIGNTGLDVSVLGFGGAPLGNMYRPLDDDQARETLQVAWDCGFRYFDTAPRYGYGLSERRTGDFLRAQSEPYILSTKVGRLLHRIEGDIPQDRPFVDALPFVEVYDYSYDAVMRSVEDSWQRLGLRRIDIAYIHDIGSLTHGKDAHPRLMRDAMEGGARALDELKKAGLIGAYGLGVNEWEVCLEALKSTDMDVFLLAGRYTLLEQEAQETFLPECLRRNASVVVGGAFNSGILVTGPKPGAKYDYEDAPQHILDRAQKIEQICNDHNVPLPAAAIQFPLTHPAVVSVIPGASSPRHVKQAVEWAELQIPSALWNDLREQGLLRADVPVPGEDLLTGGAAPGGIA